MNKTRVENLKKALGGKNLPSQVNLVLDRKEILAALSDISGDILRRDDIASKELSGKVDELKLLVAKCNSDKKFEKLLEDVNGLGALLIAIKDREYQKDIKVNNLDEVLLQLKSLNEIKDKKPIWYKEIDILDTLDKLAKIIEFYWGKVWNVKVKNTEPIIVQVVDSKKNIVNRFGSSGNIGGSPVAFPELATEATLLLVKNNTTTATGVGSGKTAVAVAGTQVALSASTVIKSVTIKALSTNTGIIYVGASTVSSADGFELNAGDTVSLDVDNLADVYVDSSVNGEGVSYIYVA